METVVIVQSLVGILTKLLNALGFFLILVGAVHVMVKVVIELGRSFVQGADIKIQVWPYLIAIAAGYFLLTL